ncbi:MAG: hypothetical protein K2X27_05185 [Candidatus Obscuribacterales bacterium]|nr:hypothetical protein [Candidatus Obscuribacterales bacterium]
MNQPNLNIEQSLFEGPLDLRGASAFRVSPELRELQEKFVQAKNEKQHMTIATSCLAMACPIMPLGFLATLFVLGKLDGMDKDPTQIEQSRSLQGEMARIAAAEALMRKKKERGEDTDANAYIRYASREMALRPLRVAMRPIKGAEKRVIPKMQSRESLCDGFFQTKEKQQKMREIKRQKILLESLADKERKENNTSEACQLSDKLEMLDKLLKKMGSKD